jgi:D-alanine-D-alanine ligase-like ATP-grasp enzyme
MGIECRVANKNTLVTNISRGGYALNIEEALKSAFPNITNDKDIKDYIDDLCYRICQRLDETGQHFAEFGLDLGIDEDKKIWIIEANVFPSFKGFKTMDHETYLKIRYAPIQYSASIAGFL